MTHLPESNARMDAALLPGAAAAADPSERAELIAGEQFVHGLLEHLRHDDPRTQQRRIAAVMSAVDATARAPRGRWTLAPRWPLASGLAAALLFVATALVVLPSSRPALAMVRTSIDATRDAPDRSYQVSAILPGDTDEPARPIARIDLRDADHLVVELQTPRGHRVVLGRNAEGSWAIRPDGTIDRYPPRHAWPRWIDVGQTSFLVDTVDDLLSALPEAYELQLGGREPLPGGGDFEFDRVTAARERGPGPEPRRVELWIDPETRLVERMELHWPAMPPRRERVPHEAAPEDRQGRGPGPGGFRPLPDREGVFPRGPRAARRSDDRDDPSRADGRPPRPPQARPPQGNGRMHRPGRPPRPPFPGGPSARGPRPMPGGPPPEFIDGRPDFARHHPPPPRVIAFERIDCPPFEDAWFAPESH